MKVAIELSDLRDETRRRIAEESKEADILICLARDKNRHVRLAVSRNPNAPQQALKILSNDKETYIRIEAIRNKNNAESE